MMSATQIIPVTLMSRGYVTLAEYPTAMVRLGKRGPQKTTGRGKQIKLRLQPACSRISMHGLRSAVASSTASKPYSCAPTSKPSVRPPGRPTDMPPGLAWRRQSGGWVCYSKPPRQEVPADCPVAGMHRLWKGDKPSTDDWKRIEYEAARLNCQLLKSECEGLGLVPRSREPAQRRWRGTRSAERQAATG
jgi:hypothetical protein